MLPDVRPSIVCGTAADLLQLLPDLFQGVLLEFLAARGYRPTHRISPVTKATTVSTDQLFDDAVSLGRIRGFLHNSPGQWRYN